VLIDVVILGDRNVVEKAEKILKYKDLTLEIYNTCECGNDIDICNDRSNLKIVYKIPERLKEKGRNQ
jgi:hypothetical protein